MIIINDKINVLTCRKIRQKTGSTLTNLELRSVIDVFISCNKVYGFELKPNFNNAYKIGEDRGFERGKENVCNALKALLDIHDCECQTDD